MKQLFFTALLLAGIFVSCKETNRNLEGSAAENGEDAARNFIRAALDGNYAKARTYLLNDSLNQQDLDVSERMYKERMSDDDKRNYRESSIRIHEVKDIDSATSIVVYSNSYRNTKDSLQVRKVNDKWLVDFKFVFKHKTDSLQ